MRLKWIAPVLVAIGLAGCAAETPGNQAAGREAVTVTPPVGETPITEPTESTPSAQNPMGGLIPDGDKQKVYGTAVITVTSPGGYKARVDLTVFEAHQVDVSYARAATSCGDPVPAELRGGKVVVYAARVEGRVKDLKANGFAWNFNTDPSVGLYWATLGVVNGDWGDGRIFPAGCGEEVVPLERGWYVPFAATSDGKFAWDVVRWSALTPNQPTVDKARIRRATLILAGIQFRGGMQCTAKLSKGMVESTWPNCSGYGPDQADMR